MKTKLHNLAAILCILSLTRLIAVLILLALVTLFTGCTSTPKIIKALGADKSSFRMRVTTIYGNVDILRANPGPGQSATVTQEGVMRIDWIGSTNVTSNRAIQQSTPTP